MNQSSLTVATRLRVQTILLALGLIAAIVVPKATAAGGSLEARVAQLESKVGILTRKVADLETKTAGVRRNGSTTEFTSQVIFKNVPVLISGPLGSLTVVEGPTQLGGDLAVGGDVSLGQDLNVIGSLTVDQNTSLGDAASDTLNISGPTNAAGLVTITNDAILRDLNCQHLTAVHNATVGSSGDNDGLTVDAGFFNAKVQQAAFDFQQGSAVGNGSASMLHGYLSIYKGNMRVWNGQALDTADGTGNLIMGDAIVANEHTFKAPLAASHCFITGTFQDAHQSYMGYLGGSNNDLNGPYSAIFNGGGCTASEYFATIVGGFNNSSNKFYGIVLGGTSRSVSNTNHTQLSNNDFGP
jgi:outer membrane murein-binding lipoprotein Lpp